MAMEAQKRNRLIALLIIKYIVDLGVVLAAALSPIHATKKSDGSCNYDTSGASSNLTSFALFSVASLHVAVATKTHCFSFRRAGLRPGGHRTLSVVFLVITWLTFIAGVGCLLAAQVNIWKSTSVPAGAADDSSCQAIQRALLAAGAVFTVLAEITMLACLYFRFKSLPDADESPVVVGEGKL